MAIFDDMMAIFDEVFMDDFFYFWFFRCMLV